MSKNQTTAKNVVPTILFLLVILLIIGMVIFADKLKSNGMFLTEIAGGARTTPPADISHSKEKHPKEEYVPDEVLVKFKPEVPPKAKDDLARQHNAKVIDEIPKIGVKVWKVNAEARDKVIEALSKNPSVEYAEKNGIVEPLYEPNDPMFSKEQYELRSTFVDFAWNFTMGSASVPIAILDTGIRANHTELAEKIIIAKNFTTWTTTTDDIHGHGTKCAGVAGAITDNAYGIAGIAGKSPLINAKIASDSGPGSTSAMANAIIWAADNGVKVVSISYGGSYGALTLKNAIDYAWSKGVVVVAGAGNEPYIIPLYPAYFKNCIAATSTDKNKDSVSGWSAYGDWVDVAAPGAGITTTNLPEKTGGLDITTGHFGTSFSSPHVAGVAALLYSIAKDINGNGRVNDEVRYYIESTADNVGSKIGGGRINAYRAVRKALGIIPETIPPTVSIISPKDGSTVSGTTTIVASATDNVAVKKVEFYINGILLDTAIYWRDPNRYSVYLQTKELINGPHTLTAKAYDLDGNVGTTSITIIVNNPPKTDTIPPTVSIISPKDGSVLSGSSLKVSASATDNIGVDRVRFSLSYFDPAGWNSGSTDTTPPYEATWNMAALDNGPYNLTATAYDLDGNVGTTSITIIVNNPDTFPPIISNGAVNGQPTVDGYLLLPIGTKQATISIKTNEPATCKYLAVMNKYCHSLSYSQLPHTFSTTGGTSHSQLITGLTDGNTYLFCIMCSDQYGNVKRYYYPNYILFSVSIDATPPVITFPANGATVSGTTTIKVSPKGSWNVAFAELYINGSSYGDDTTAPFEFTWDTTKVSNGPYTLIAKVYDKNDTNWFYNVVNSSPITVIVNNPVPPDTTPPIRSNGQPTGSLPAGTKQATISLTTNEPAICRYSTTAGTSYDSMTNTFSTTGGTPHFELITGLTDGNTYKFYVRCSDLSGNKNTDDYLISFSVDSPVLIPLTTFITNPKDGQRVSGVIYLNITSIDEIDGLRGVEIYIDGKHYRGLGLPVCTYNYISWNPSWNTSRYADGLHTLNSKAYNCAGKAVNSSVITVKVDNTPDTTPPILSNIQATGITANSATITWTTDDSSNSTVYYGTVSPSSIKSDPSLLTSHSITLTSLLSNTIYYYQVKSCNNNNLCNTSSTYSFTTLASSPDTTPPVRSNGQPTGSLPAGTKQATISLTTNEPAICRYSTTAGTSYDSMTNTFSTTGGTSHSQLITGLTDGNTYKFYVRCSDLSGNKNTDDYLISFNVSFDTTPPTVSITSPANGATVSGTVTVSASASDNVGVTKVEFYRDGDMIGTDTTSPYSTSWDTTPLTDGTYTLQAKAYDAKGNIGSSSFITVTVSNIIDNTPPTVSIVYPTNGSTVARRSTVTITATATDNTAVTKVEFYVKGRLECIDTTSPYTCNWFVPAKRLQTYELQAKAYDAKGNTALSTIVTVKSSN